MGVKKGTDNFLEFRKERTEKTVKKISLALEEARKHAFRFADENGLARWVAHRIQVHRTTITRSPIYMAEIRTHFERQSGAGTLHTSEDSSPGLLLAKIKALELSNTQLAKENARLLAFLERQALQSKAVTEMPTHGEVPGVRNDDRRLEGAIADMSRMFMSVVQRFDSMIIISADTKTIEDGSKRKKSPERVIASGPSVEHFFRWYADK